MIRDSAAAWNQPGSPLPGAAAPSTYLAALHHGGAAEIDHLAELLHLLPVGGCQVDLAVRWSEFGVDGGRGLMQSDLTGKVNTSKLS
jgi:hypothetical protein